MIDLDRLKRRFEKETNDSHKAEERNRKKIERKRERELTRIREKYQREIDAKHNSFDTKREGLYQEHLRRSAGEIVGELKKDYETLQERSVLLDISEDSMNRAEQARQALDIFEESDKREAVLSLMEAMGANETVRRDMDVLEMARNSKTITSYIGAEKDGRVYLLVPTDGQDNKKLADNLENKLLAVGDHGKVISGNPKTYDHKQLSVVSARSNTAEEISFAYNVDNINGFMLYTFRPVNPNLALKLEQGLAQKLNELQPEGFAKANIRHNVQIVDFDIIDYFKNHDLDEMYSMKDQLEQLTKSQSSISYELASEITARPKATLRSLLTRGRIKESSPGYIEITSLIEYLESAGRPSQASLSIQRSSRVDSEEAGARMNYSSTESGAIRREAHARLQEVAPNGGELNTHQLRYVFGARSNSFSTVVAREPDMAPYVEKRKEGQYTRLFFKVEGVKKYLESRHPTNQGWIKN